MRRVVVIGLDGVTFDVIRPLVAAGRLPCMAGLMQRGVAGSLRSTLPPLTMPAWSSFITGVNPGKHSLVDFIRRQPGSYDYAPVGAADRQAESLWSMVSRQGKRVIVINVPGTYPPESVNGCLVSGMMTPSSAATFTHPPELTAELHRFTGGYRTHTGWAYSRGRVERFVRSVYDTTEVQVQVVKHLMAQQSWDLFVYVFTGTDRLQHGLWHCMDAEHPLHPQNGPNPHRETIPRFYERVDQYLADLTHLAGDETAVIIMSDHGFGPFHKFIHVNNWLMNWGLLQLRDSPGVRLKHALFRQGLNLLNLYNVLLPLGLGGLKGAVSKGRNRGWLRHVFLSFADVDWSRTRAYSLGTTGQVYINLRGREPQGIVTPGREYETLRDELIARLRGMCDPETGEPLADEVYRQEELYSGPYLHLMPDLVFVPRGFVYNAFGEYEFASRSLVDVSQGITGWHRMDGVLIMAGDGIAQGRTIGGARLVDLTPTILHLLELGVPSGLDGRVLYEALTMGARPPQHLDPSSVWEDALPALSPAEISEITERLRQLGYLS
jgi:predicted AlkP superfamily phosphohydrolase/phosphomutase